MTEDQAWIKRIPPLTAIDDEVINELVEVWNKTQLPYISNRRAKAILSKLYDEFSKDEKRRGNNAAINMEKYNTLFDICTCKCDPPLKPGRYREMACLQLH